jgi:hypothetical protein
MSLPGAPLLVILSYIAIRYLYRGTIRMFFKVTRRGLGADLEVGMNKEQ